MNNRPKILLNIILYSVLTFYLVILFALLFLKANSVNSVNLMPFDTIGSFLFSDDPILQAFAFTNVVGNIVLFVPLGVYLPLLIQEKSVFKNWMWIVLISTAAEIFQFVFKVGATDIDDVILNGLGGFLGIVAYRILCRIFVDAYKVKVVITLGAPIAAILSVVGIMIYNA